MKRLPLLAAMMLGGCVASVSPVVAQQDQYSEPEVMMTLTALDDSGAAIYMACVRIDPSHGNTTFK